MLKKAASIVLASTRSSTGTRPPHHSAARTDVVLLVRRTVRPRGYASGLYSLRPCLGQGSSLGEEAVLADSGREGEIVAEVGRVRCLAFLSLLRNTPLSSDDTHRLRTSRLSCLSLTSHLSPHTFRSSRGFTILEIIIVLFLLVSLLGIVLPRISLEENLGSVGRQMVRTVRSIQDLAMVIQKPVRLYVDIDRGVYWLMILDGNQENVPIDHPTWATPLHLPAAVRISDMVIGQAIKSSGRVDLAFYPTGRIDPMTMHLVDTHNNLLAIAIEPVTGAIRMSDERIEPPPSTQLIILDRVKPLLKMTEVVKDSRPR